MDYHGKISLVTGASSGIGEEFARTLARQGSDLVLVARSRDTLQKLADELGPAHDITAHVIACDLTAPGAAATVKAETDRLGLDIDVLVNSAGFGSAGRFGEISPERVSQEVALDVSAVVDLTRAYLPEMAERRNGVIVNVASTAGLVPTPYMSVYGASKAFVVAFSETLWTEYRASGVRVVALCPGPVDTGFFSAMGTSETAVGPVVTTRKVVDAALRAVDRGRPRVVPGLVNHLLIASVRLSPRRLALGIAERMLRGAKGTASATPS